MREILKKIVELRGFLHHHTLKRKDIWHPEDHNKYETDAHFFQAVAFTKKRFNEFIENIPRLFLGLTKTK